MQHCFKFIRMWQKLSLYNQICLTFLFQVHLFLMGLESLRLNLSRHKVLRKHLHLCLLQNGFQYAKGHHNSRTLEFMKNFLIKIKLDTTISLHTVKAR